MQNSTYVPPPRYSCTEEAAPFLSLSARMLEKHRTYGTGPLYRKIGGRIVTVALANKMARIAWALLVKQENHRAPVAVRA